MQYTCREGESDFPEYFLEFFSYALQILHESNTSMKTCLSEKINVISPFKNFLETFEKKVSRQKVNFLVRMSISKFLSLLNFE